MKIVEINNYIVNVFEREFWLLDSLYDFKCYRLKFFQGEGPGPPSCWGCFILPNIQESVGPSWKNFLRAPLHVFFYHLLIKMYTIFNLIYINHKWIKALLTHARQTIFIHKNERQVDNLQILRVLNKFARLNMTEQHETHKHFIKQLQHLLNYKENVQSNTLFNYIFKNQVHNI